jgi:hypothetical protein
MAEVLVNFTEPIKSKAGDLYYGRVLGKPANDGLLWEGWLDFTLAGSDEVISTRRETEQRNRDDLRYWAQGLTMAYLQGSLERALSPAPIQLKTESRVTVESTPRPNPPRPIVVPKRVILDPFQTYVQGEDLLRNQLYAISHDDLQNIIEAYNFPTPDGAPSVSGASHTSLVDQIVKGVRARYAGLADVSAARTEPAAEAGRQNATAEDRPA